MVIKKPSCRFTIVYYLHPTPFFRVHTGTGNQTRADGLTYVAC